MGRQLAYEQRQIIPGGYSADQADTYRDVPSRWQACQRSILMGERRHAQKGELAVIAKRTGLEVIIVDLDQADG